MAEKYVKNTMLIYHNNIAQWLREIKVQNIIGNRREKKSWKRKKKVYKLSNTRKYN